MIDPTQVQFYINTPNGTLGPFASRLAADMALAARPLAEQAQSWVQGMTGDGKTVLLG